MTRTVSLIIILIFVKLAFPVKMNDQGNFASDDNSNNIQFFSEGQQLQVEDQTILAEDNNIYLNGKSIAKLQNFFTIISSSKEVFVVTRNTIFSLTGFELDPIISFGDQIYDITYFNGDLHVSLKNKIYDGYKFTHNVISENKKISKVGFTIIDTDKINSVKNTKTTAGTPNYKNKNSSSVSL